MKCWGLIDGMVACAIIKTHGDYDVMTHIDMPSVFLNFCVWNAHWTSIHWASYQMRNIEGCACAGNAGNVFPRRRLQRKPLVSDPGMHHGTCAPHVPWCMSGSLAPGGGENVPGIPGAYTPAIFRIWQEANRISEHCSWVWLWLAKFLDCTNIHYKFWKW